MKYHSAFSKKFEIFDNYIGYPAEPFKKQHDVKWKDSCIPFSGKPYFVIGRQILDCHYGKYRKIKSKEKRLTEVRPCFMVLSSIGQALFLYSI